MFLIKKNKKQTYFILIFFILMILISPEFNPLNFFNSDYLKPNFIVSSAVFRNQNDCEVWLKNVGKSQAFELKYYIDNELTGSYDSSGTTLNFTVNPGRFLIAFTELNNETATKVDREICLKYYWNKNGVKTYVEQKIIFNVILEKFTN